MGLAKSGLTLMIINRSHPNVNHSQRKLLYPSLAQLAETDQTHLRLTLRN